MIEDTFIEDRSEELREIQSEEFHFHNKIKDNIGKSQRLFEEIIEIGV